MRFTSSQTSFKSGRLSPKLFNRVDTSQYRDGASELIGCRPLPEGGVERIKGYRVVPQAFYAGNGNYRDVKMFSFMVHGQTVVACIKRETVFMNNDVKIAFSKFPYKRGLIGTETTLIQAGTTAYPAKEFDWAVLNNRLFLTHYSGTMIPFIFEFAEDLSTYATQVWINSASPALPLNKNYGTGGSYPFFNGPSAGLNFYLYPLNDLSETNAAITFGAFDTGTGTINITSTDPATQVVLQKTPVIYAEALGSADFGDGYSRRVVASAFYYRTSGTVTNGAKFITNVIWNGTKDTFNALNVTTTTMWSSAAWGEYNWPRTVTSHEGRLVWGGTPKNPLSFYGSRVSNAFFMTHLKHQESGTEFLTYPAPSGATLATDPYTFTVATKEDSAITFIRSAQNLVLGTDRKEYIASGGDTILSALSVNIKPQTSQGSVPVTTASNGNSVFYLSNEGKQLFKFKYNDANGSFISQELSLLFNDLLEEDRIMNIEWVPHISSLMVATEAGKFYGIVDNPQTETTAFYDTGISYVNGTGLAFVAAREAEWSEGDIGDHLLFLGNAAEGVCSLEQTYYENGMDGFMSNDRYFGGIVEDVVGKNMHLYLYRAINVIRTGPGAYTIGSTPVTTAVGNFPVPLDIFEFRSHVRAVNIDTGEFLDLPVIHPDNDNGDGYVEITDASFSGASSLVIGLTPYETVGFNGELLQEGCMYASTMPVEAGQQWGTSQMGIKNIDTVGIRVYRSYSIEIGGGEGIWEEKVFATDEGKARSGRAEVKFSSSPKYDQVVYLRNTKAEPCTIIGLNMRGVSNDG